MEARMMEEREPCLADQQRMAKIFQYMQSLGAAQIFAPLPPLFPPVEPAQFHTHVSIKILVMHDIYLSGITHAISSPISDRI
jgi:ArsR family metal-binding transcriptional regulator